MLSMPLSQLLQLLAPLLVVQLVLVVVGLVSLAKTETPRYLPKWAWAIIIIFVATIGAIVYLIFGRERDV